MEAIYGMLMERARVKHGAIQPIGETFQSGFQCDEGFAQFWFNTPDHSTHLVYEALSGTAS
jgi:hypothetical protein